MPQQDKSAATPPRKSLEGTTLRPTDTASLHQALQTAVDYRGDVTLHLKGGATIEGFVFTFEEKADKLHLFIKQDNKTSAPSVTKASDVEAIDFSGADIAFGKSWDDWQVKSDALKQAEIERAEKAAKNLGIL